MAEQLKPRVAGIVDRWRDQARQMEREFYSDESALNALLDELDEAIGRRKFSSPRTQPAPWSEKLVIAEAVRAAYD